MELQAAEDSTTHMEPFGEACLRKATFVKVGTLHPDAHGVNLLLKARTGMTLDVFCKSGLGFLR